MKGIVFSVSMAILIGLTNPAQIDLTEGYLRLLFSDNQKEEAMFCEEVDKISFKIYPDDPDVKWNVDVCYFLSREVNDKHVGDAEVVSFTVNDQCY